MLVGTFEAVPWFHYAVALLILDQLYGRSWVRRRSRISDCARRSVNIWTWCKCRRVQSANASGSAVAARVSVGHRNGIQETGWSLIEVFLWSRRPISLSLFMPFRENGQVTRQRKRMRCNKTKCKRTKLENVHNKRE